MRSRERASDYIRLLSDAGEKGGYFRKNEGLPSLKEKIQVYYDEKLNNDDIESQTSGSTKYSKYVSTTKDFEVAKSFALRKKRKGEILHNIRIC